MHGDQSQLAQLCYKHDLLSDTQCRDGQGIFIRNNGCKVDEALVEEIDDLICNTLEDCEDYENKNIEIGCENIDAVLRNSLNRHLHKNNDSLVIKRIKKEIFDWNIRFLAIDNACFSLDELSTKYWGKFKVNIAMLKFLFEKNVTNIIFFFYSLLGVQNIFHLNLDIRLYPNLSPIVWVKKIYV